MQCSLLIYMLNSFTQAHKNGVIGLDQHEFREAMRKTMGDRLTDAEIDLLFMKVN